MVTKPPTWNPEGFWRGLMRRRAADGGPVFAFVGRRRAKIMRRERSCLSVWSRYYRAEQRITATLEGEVSNPVAVR